MVMHARKPRVEDGYFERHQSHPYQSGTKYASGSKSSYSDRYSNDRVRESPSSNINGSSQPSRRSDSPDSRSQSPRERPDRSERPHNQSQQLHKASYSQRMRDKERERDREGRDYKIREKDRDDTRSPKERSFRDTRDTERRTNHDRSGEDRERDKDKERDKVVRVGDWTEHVSSSGKKYYYHCKTEVSQWEKPREWLEYERERDNRENRDRDRDRSSTQSRVRDRDRDRDRDTRDRDRDRDRPVSSAQPQSTGGTSDRSEQRERERERSRISSSSGVHNDQRHSNHSNHNRLPSTSGVDLREAARNVHEKDKTFRRQSYDRAELDVSPSGSTPTSEASAPLTVPSTTPSTPTATVLTQSLSGPSSSSIPLANALPRLLSHPPSTPTSQSSQAQPMTVKLGPSSGPSHATQAMASPSGLQGFASPSTAVSLASLPQYLTNTGTNSLSRLANNLAMGGFVGLPALHGQDLSTQEALHTLQTALLLSSQAAVAAVGTVNMGVTANGTVTGQPALQVEVLDSHDGGRGPPTPTHSERHDSRVEPVELRRANSGSSLSSLSAASVGLRPSVTSLTLTPSLASHFRPDLAAHVTGWPAEQIEKQCQRIAEEGQTLGNLHNTKISADLKMARSLVRVADIQATLQEQRILFLRQQIRELEGMKTPNTFMSSDG